jgi:superfamily II DNA or RNA helicase
MVASAEPDVEFRRLQAENLRLIELLEAHGIEWREQAPRTGVSAAPSRSPVRLSAQERVELFRGLFRGRTDVFPVRWESKSTGKSGYAPACANEWRSGVCRKPVVKCGDCAHREFLPLTQAVVVDHLKGEHVVGVYPMLADDTCHFLAVDFDDDGWREDVTAFAATGDELGVPVGVEVSRSGEGAHAWIFFSTSVGAREARRLGTALISHTCARSRQLKLSSYDRLFPSQDTMPKGGFGNLIALPLQKEARARECSVFVDRDLRPYADQWAYLDSLRRMDPQDIDVTVMRATPGSHPLDVTFIDDEDLAAPWKRVETGGTSIPGPLPKSISGTLANMLYLEKEALPQPLLNRLVRLAAFQNPEFYRAQALRLSVWDKPRVIGCAENFPRHIGLPRGCCDAVRAVCSENGIELNIDDERLPGCTLDVPFTGELRLDQEAAVAAMLGEEFGVLCAPTAFGKTVTAAALIARRRTSTLILVHRTELLKQWQERLQTFLAVEKGDIGFIGGGKTKPSGRIDIAVMQSLSRKGEVSAIVENYGQVIIDECHHVGASSFDQILRKVKAKYVVGLTATPIRRDGQHPIIFMQCGPIRHRARPAESTPKDLRVQPRWRDGPLAVPVEQRIQDVFLHLAKDQARTVAIVEEVVAAYLAGRKILVLTERSEHLEMMVEGLEGALPNLFALHGRMPKKARATLIARLDRLPADEPRVLVATGRLVGEGFDHPPLDTLVLAMPISWKGTLQQYAGRLHRDSAFKRDVRIIDFVDTGHPALLRMWERRQRGYRAMGYVIDTPHSQGM